MRNDWSGAVAERGQRPLSPDPSQRRQAASRAFGAAGIRSGGPPSRGAEAPVRCWVVSRQNRTVLRPATSARNFDLKSQIASAPRWSGQNSEKHRSTTTCLDGCVTRLETSVPVV